MESRGTVPQEEEEQGRGSGKGIPRRMPRLCAALGRYAARTAEAAGHPWRLGQSVSDDGFPGRGDDRCRAVQVRGERQPLSRRKAGDVVPGRKDRTGRSRSRVRRPDRQPADRCGVRDHRKPDPRTGRRACGDLDDDPVDDPGEPGFGLWAGCRLRPVHLPRSQAANRKELPHGNSFANGISKPRGWLRREAKR